MNKNYHHGNLRIALIEAGIKIINKEGLSQLSLRKAAALCNVSHTAPYSHFKDKEELLEAMQNHVSTQFTLMFENIIQTNDKDNPNIIAEMGISYILFFIDNPQYFNFLFFQGNLKINIVIDGKKDSFSAFQIFKDTAVRILKNLGMSEEKIQDFIIMKWATVHGLASIATMKGVDYDKDWKSKIKELFNLDESKKFKSI
ncbi:MAG: TetR/AcrR family transcriptional regulator [Firmicutes bacterium]|nr:TetR/AcrR family transcriptional regulator [Bacillota bacterium]